MTYIETVIKALATPDAQKRDWYGWATNQMSHVLLGLLGAMLFSVYSTLLLAVIKEFYDIASSPTRSTVKDSFIDLTFWSIGCVIVTLDQPYLGVVLLVAALATGVFARLKRVVNNGRTD